MAQRPLRPSPFRGDPDAEELRSFFQPERHFDGAVAWTFGTSLKSAYVNSYEFMNEAPVVVLWRDAPRVLRAVSRLALGEGAWFHQADPGHRGREDTRSFIEHADETLTLLTDHESWRTVRYVSNTEGIDQLERAGYVRNGIDEVLMERSLTTPIRSAGHEGFTIRDLDHRNATERASRALAQVTAFSDGTPTEGGRAWITRSLPHQLSYVNPDDHPHIVAVDDAETVLGFADTFLDRRNRIGEFEPVGTRTDVQGRGIANAVLTFSLARMQQEGMQRAIVRTGAENTAAIAAYQSVGFEITDQRMSMRKDRA